MSSNSPTRREALSSTGAWAAERCQPTPPWTPKPTQAPAPTEIPPLPTPIPVFSVVWSDQATAVNLRDAPAEKVISAVANGQSVVVSNEVVKSEGYIWVLVTVSVGPLDREDWLYSWTCPVCGTGHLGVRFGQRGF